jgi:hypothetical protein
VLKAPEISLTLRYCIYKINMIWFVRHHKNNGTESIFACGKTWFNVTYSQSCKAVTTVKLHCLISSWLMSHSVKCRTPLISKSPTCTYERSVIQNINNRLNFLALRIDIIAFLSLCLCNTHCDTQIFMPYVFHTFYTHWSQNQILWFQKTKLHL